MKEEIKKNQKKRNDRPQIVNKNKKKAQYNKFNNN